MPYCPYMYRYTLTIWKFSIRVHHWLRSDDKRAFHDHPWWFFTLVLKGGYRDVTPTGSENLSFLSFKYRPAHHTHYVEVGDKGCWSLLLTGPAVHKWGFVLKDGKRLRKDKYFKKFGHPPCTET